jgi:hypothetical protein
MSKNVLRKYDRANNPGGRMEAIDTLQELSSDLSRADKHSDERQTEAQSLHSGISHQE